MRGGLVAALISVSMLSAVPLAGAGSRQRDPTPSMIVTASPDTAGAASPRLILTLRYAMQCGYPGAGKLVVSFPSAVKLPKQFAANAVRLAGKPIAASRAGRQVTVTIAPPSGPLCGVIVPGALKLVFTRKAGLANPKRAGSYRFRATHAKRAFASKLRIKPAS